MLLGYRRKQNNKRNVSWVSEIFTQLPSKVIPADAKTFYTHRLANAETFNKQDRLSHLFTSLGHRPQPQVSDGKPSVQKKPAAEHFNLPYPADNLLNSHLIHDNKYLQKWPAIFSDLTVTNVIDETENVKTF
jgi:hypothetical protein